MVVRNAGKKRLVGVGCAVVLSLAMTASGCGNPGEGTVKVDPRVNARLGKPRGIPPAAYKENSVEPIGSKSWSRKNAAAK